MVDIGLDFRATVWALLVLTRNHVRSSCGLLCLGAVRSPSVEPCSTSWAKALGWAWDLRSQLGVEVAGSISR